MEKINVLLTSTGGAMGYSNLEALKSVEEVNEVIAADCDPQSLARHYGYPFVVLPKGDDERYFSEVLKACRKEKVKVIIPSSDEEAIKLAHYTKELSQEGIISTGPRGDQLEAFTHKEAMFEFLSSQGIPVPRMEFIKNKDQLNARIKEFGYPEKPVLIKPIFGRGGRGVWEICENLYSFEELMSSRVRGNRRISLEMLNHSLKHYDKPLELILMEYYDGSFYDVDVVAKNGKPIYLIPRRRHHWLNIPFNGFTLEKNEAALELATKVCETLGLTYLFDFDMVVDSKGEMQLIDVNPRMSGATAAVSVTGINLLDVVIKLALGKEIKRVEIPFGMEVKSMVKPIVV